MRILLVEDEADLRTEIREYLQRRGHEVTDCGLLGDGRAAVRQLAAGSTPPEVIICDVNLPDGNGVDFYVAVSSELPNCQWVLMSGDPDLDQIDKVSGGIGLAPCVVVEKPVSLRTLCAAFTRT